MHVERRTEDFSADHILTDQSLARLGLGALARLIREECETNAAFRARVSRQLDRIGANEASETITPGSAGEPHMVGRSAPMLRVFEAIRKMSISDVPVLITGESGTGKELAALAIHERSNYRDGPFVAINCAAIPESLISSELFGHEKGAFTGAHQTKIGRIESAQGGTLFLDEIGDVPLELQTHLLRFLQEKALVRVGGRRSIEVDARIVSATNRPLERAISEGRFREDLYYRLNVLRIEMPPLRERGDDLALLATYFLQHFAGEIGRPIEGFDGAARAAIATHPWPGNVRELISCIRRAVVMADGTTIGVGDLGLFRADGNGSPAAPPSTAAAQRDSGPDALGPTADGMTLEEAKKRTEVQHLAAALDRTGNNVSAAAKELGVSRVTLYRLLNKHGLSGAADQG